MSPVEPSTGPARPSRPARYVVIGSGWRSTVFLRLAELLPEQLEVVGVVTRREERGREMSARWATPSFRSLAEAAARRPDFVVPLVPREVMADSVREAVSLGLPVLAETPPTTDAESLHRLWRDVGGSGLVQVAEQYPRYPGHAARIRLATEGTLGTVGEVQVSSTHDYHAVALVRALLGGVVGEATVHAHVATAPLADPVDRDGWSGGTAVRRARRVLAHLELGDGLTGLYDFTDNQWHNPLRTRRVVVRGSLGELVDDQVVRLVDSRTVVTSRLERRQTGVDLNLEGMDLDHVSLDGRVLWRNRWQGTRLADDELAVADLLADTAAWVLGDGPQPYPLAEACQDHLIGLAIAEAVGTGRGVRVPAPPWA